eukprot:1284970-Prymnesium_polylepis.1
MSRSLLGWAPPRLPWLVAWFVRGFARPNAKHGPRRHSAWRGARGATALLATSLGAMAGSRLDDDWQPKN